MKLITREIDYAIRALKYIAEKGKEIVSVTAIAQDLGITRPMLRKIMQELAKAGMVISYKGNNGGFSLGKRPGDIYLLELVQIFQGKFSLNECVLNKEICPNRKSCILRGKIEDIEENVKRQLESINLKSLMIKEGN